jgi:hypothetical protein
MSLIAPPGNSLCKGRRNKTAQVTEGIAGQDEGLPTTGAKILRLQRDFETGIADRNTGEAQQIVAAEAATGRKQGTG